jgi:cytosine/adenosine deaminase-related metal-dependent hydrolase
MQLLFRGVKVGLGVDGSASNDSSHLLAEARAAMLVARLEAGLSGASLSGEESPALMTARQALEIATRGGAEVLGRDDIGSLEVNKRADFFAINLNRLEFAGALHDPVSAVIFCAPVRADYTFIEGRAVVTEGRLTTIDLPVLVQTQNRAARRLLNG